MALQSSGIQKHPSNQLQSGAPNPYSPPQQSFQKKKDEWWKKQKAWEQPGGLPYSGPASAFQPDMQGYIPASQVQGANRARHHPQGNVQDPGRVRGYVGRKMEQLTKAEYEARLGANEEWGSERWGAKGYAGGGYVKPRGYAGGGVAQGTDTVPAMLTPGEFVVSRPAVRQIGLNNLMSMNARGGGTNRPRVQGGRMYAQGGGMTPGGGKPPNWKPSRISSPTQPKPFKGANNNFLVDLATDYQNKLDEANQANIDRYDEMMAGYDTMHGNVMGGLSDASAAAQAGYQGVLGGYGDLSSQIQGGYDKLSGEVLGGLDKASAEAKAGYQDVIGGYGGLTDELRAGYGGLHGRVMDNYGALHGRTMGGMAGDVRANEAQYANILGGFGDLRGRVLGGMETLGQDQIAESGKAYDESLAATGAQMASRGMGGTTVGASIRQGTDRGYQDAVRGIQESVLARKAAADMGISQAQLSQAGQFQNAREMAQARRIAADMGISQASIGADMGISQAGMGAVAGMGQAGLGAQQNMIQQQLAAADRRAAANMGISQAGLGAAMGLGQAGLGAQQNMIQQQLSAAHQQAAMDQSISQSKLGAIERREDEHPSFANLMALAQGAAAGGYGQGYGGGSGGGDPSGMFSINDYFGGGGGGNPYEALAAGLLGHGSQTAETKPAFQYRPTR